MIALTLADLALLVGGSLHGADPAALVDGPVVIDSRAAVPGGLFVAFKGERFDGHDFGASAIASGAVAVLGERSVDGVPTVQVDNVLAALSRLARGVLDQLPGAAVVALTGSSGKTGTKDLVAGLLERVGPTVSTLGSYNNEIGLPLTVLEAGPSTAFLVLEMGARGSGHIHDLTRTAPPRTGVVLNVGSAHLGEFGSRTAIAEAKAELVEALPSDGLAVLNADDPLVAPMSARTGARVVTFGLSPSADVRAEDVQLAAGRPRFRLTSRQGSAAVTLQLVGAHQVSNALAAAAVGLSAEMSVQEVAAGLAAARPRSPWRMEVGERADGVTILNDAYNANPESMAAALQALVDVADGRRTWAVLGEMRELGPGAAAEHDAIGRLAVQLGVDRLVAVGQEAGAVHVGAGLAGTGTTESAYVPDVEAALRLLAAELAPGDVVLVKASRGARLERLAAALLREDGA